MIAPIIALIVLIGLLVLEAAVYHRSVQRIPLRIHVNGTRGKSTVTEYLAEALRQPGRVTMGKITGVIPTLIINGRRKHIERHGNARLQEQFGIIRRAGKQGCDHLILECMSIDPELQKTEASFFCPHLYIITNLRDDHREVSGPAKLSYMDAICQAIPPGCTVLTSETEQFERIATAAARKRCPVVRANDELPDILCETSLPPNVIRENLALALTACRLLGTDPSVAANRLLDLIRQQPPRLLEVDPAKGISFLNGFDSNDTASAEIFLDQCRSMSGKFRALIVILNTRPDRPGRTRLFTEWIPGIPGLTHVFVSGGHRINAMRQLRSAGMDKAQVTGLHGRDIRNIQSIIVETTSERTLIFGVGNISGDGFRIVEALS